MITTTTVWNLRNDHFMEAKQDKGTFLLCLAIFINKITIVLQWTKRPNQLNAESSRDGSSSYVEDVGKRTSRAGRLRSGTAVASTVKLASAKPWANCDEMTAQVLSHPVATDLTDNKQKDDDVLCMSPEYFHIEENRLRTFAHWPVSFISPNVLARYGFYYDGNEDSVKCYFCRVEIGLWEPQDDVIQEHLRWSPYCALLKKRPTNNVPINSNYLDAVPEPSYDTCGITIRHRSFAENHGEPAYELPLVELDLMVSDSWVGAADEISLSSSASSRNSNGGTMDIAGSGLQQDHRASAMATGVMRGPEYPNFAIEADRLKSYEDWPTSLKQKPQTLSDAGFFYTGKSDRVKCFSCGGGLKDWEQDDEPWEQHAIWYNNCHYLQLMKGPEFIRKCNALKEAAAAADVTGNYAGSSSSSQPSTSGISSASSSIMSTSPASSSRLSSPSPIADVDDETTLRCGSDISGGEDAGHDESGNRKLSDGKICKICFVNEYNTAFMPCGHVVACAKCASSVNKCPLCQQPFINVLRLYLS